MARSNGVVSISNNDDWKGDSFFGSSKQLDCWKVSPICFAYGCCDFDYSLHVLSAIGCYICFLSEDHAIPYCQRVSTHPKNIRCNSPSESKKIKPCFTPPTRLSCRGRFHGHSEIHNATLHIHHVDPKPYRGAPAHGSNSIASTRSGWEHTDPNTCKKECRNTCQKDSCHKMSKIQTRSQRDCHNRCQI